jgi:hypothetical protein
MSAPDSGSLVRKKQHSCSRVQTESGEADFHEAGVEPCCKDGPYDCTSSHPGRESPDDIEADHAVRRMRVNRARCGEQDPCHRRAEHQRQFMVGRAAGANENVEQPGHENEAATN